MDWNNISGSDIVTVLCGFFAFIYFVGQAAQKFFSNIGWFKEQKEKKENAEKQKRKTEWKEFFKEATNEREESEKEKRRKEWKDLYNEAKDERKEQEQIELKILYDKFTDEFVEKHAMSVVNKLEETNAEQNKKIDKLIVSSNDILRNNLTTIYYKYLPQKKIPIYFKKQFMKEYEDYHEQGGNTFADDIYEQVKTWEVVEDDSCIFGKEVKN